MNIVKDYEINYDDYLDVKSIIAHYEQYGFDKLVLITDNGTGKTYTATNWVCEVLKNGGNACWIRNTDIEGLKCVNGLNAGLTRNGLDDKFYAKNDGIYEIDSITRAGNKKPGALRCPIVYLSSLSKSIPQEIHAELIVMDEFIDGSDARKFVLKDYAGDMKKAMSRLIRPITKPVHTIALANPHTPTSDLLYSLGIDFDWDVLASGRVSYSYNENTHTVGICIPKQFNIKEMESTYTYWNGLSSPKENYKYKPNKFKRIQVVPDDCVDWLGRISFNNSFFVYGLFESMEGRKKLTHMYCKKCEPMEYEKFNAYACTPMDAVDGAIWINEAIDRVPHYSRLINASMKSDCYFDCDFTQTSIKKLHGFSMSIYHAGYSIR